MKDKTFYAPYPSFWLLFLLILKWLELKVREKLESDKKEEL
jgi:hypothetical protein